VSADPRQKILDAEGASEFLRFREQCFLIKNMHMLQNNKEMKKERYSRYQDFTPMNGDPFRVIGAFGGLVDNDRLLQLTPEQLSVLVPMVKIFKVGRVAKAPTGREVAGYSEFVGWEITDQGMKPIGREVGGYSVADEQEFEDRMFGEYTFKDYTDTSPERIVQMQLGSKLPGMSGLGHGGVVGLKSFTYEYDGGNPEIPKAGIAHVKLDFFFSDIRLLFERGRNGLSFIDLITYRPAHSSKAASVKCGNKEIPLSEFYDDDHFSIKLVFGWETPGNLDSIPRAQFQDHRDMRHIKNAVKDSQSTLILNLMRHTFDYHDDGTMTLSVEYIGRKEATLRADNYDIFWQPSPMKTLVQKMQSQLDKIEESEQILTEQVINDPSDKQKINEINQQLTSQREAKISAKNRLSVVQLKNRRHVYKRLMSYMYERNMIMRFWVAPSDIVKYNQETDSWSSGVSVAQYAEGIAATYLTGEEQLVSDLEKENQEFVVHAPGYNSAPSELDLKRAARRTTPGTVSPDDPWSGADATVPSAPEETEHAMDDVLVNAEKVASAGKPINMTNAAKLAAEHHLQKLADVQALELAAAHAENYSIKFFYFGDLLQAALDIVQGWDAQLGDYILDSDDAAKKTQIMQDMVAERERIREEFDLNIVLGEIRWTDPKGKMKVANIADLPVAVNAFVAWFNKTVVGELKGSWNLRQFIKDVLAEFFPTILGEECTIPEQESSGVNASPKVTMTTLTLPKCKKGKKSPNGCIPRPYKKFKTENIDPTVTGRAMDYTKAGFNLKDLYYTKYFKKRRRMKPAPIQYKKTKDIEQVLYIYWFAYDRLGSFNGDINQDRKNFINHYYVGTDRGLVKGIKFKRNDIQYHREGRILSDSCREGQLREPYDATITLFGNPLIKPGQYIYISPSPFLGREGYGKLLGMTGYYYVTKVRGEIRQGTFETTVEGFWQQYARRGKKAERSHEVYEMSLGEVRATLAEQQAAANPPEQVPAMAPSWYREQEAREGTGARSVGGYGPGGHGRGKIF